MLNPYAFSLAIKRSWEKQSNAFDRSVRSTPSAFLILIADFHFSNIDSRQCWALNRLLNPHRYFDKKDSKCSDICLNMNFSYAHILYKYLTNTNRSVIFFELFEFFYELVLYLLVLISMGKQTVKCTS